MKKILLSILLNTLFYSVFAHNGSIRGAVYDAQSNLPIEGANVLIVGQEQTATSDIFGNFKLQQLEAGTYTLKVSFVGYQTEVRAGVAVLNAETTQIKIILQEKSINLEEVLVQYDAERNFNTISQIDLSLRPFQNAQEVLRVVPGLFIAQHAGGGKAEQIFLRGFDIDHGTDIQITVDNMPVNMVSHAHGQGYADLHFLIPELIEDVDFRKGSYEAEKGNFSTAGYVNFNTSNRLRQSMVKMEVGQFDTYRLLGMYDLLGEKGNAKNQSAYIASEYSFSNGYFESPQNLNRINIFGKYHGLIAANRLLTVSLSTFSSQWDASGQIPERAVANGSISRFGAIDDTEGGNTSRSNVNIELNTFNENGGIFSNQVFYTYYDFELYSNFTFFLEKPTEGDQIRQKESRNIFGYNVSYSQSYNLGKFEASTKVGVSLRYDDVNDNELSFTQNRRTITEYVALGNIDEINIGFFLDQNIQFSPKLKINLGLRFDHFRFTYEDLLQTQYLQQSYTESLLSPKLNLYYQVSPKTQLYLNSGFSFHSNDTRAVVTQKTDEILPRALGNEIGSVFKPFDKLMCNISAWTLNLEQEFVYVGDAGIVEPSGETFRAGFDFSIRWQMLDWLYMDLDFNQTLARATSEPEEADYIPLAPLQTSTAGLTAQFDNGFSLSLRSRYLGDRPANEDNSIIAQGYFLLDALASYTQEKYELGLNIQNLLNQEWKEAQFDTESRLFAEPNPISEIHFTPGSPFFLRFSASYFF